MKKSIIEFCEAYKAKKFMTTKNGVDERQEYLKKELEVKEYIPFAKKRDICKKIINACCTKDSSGLIKVDSVSRYMIFTISIISAYTALEFSSGDDEEFDSLDEYDMLCQNGLLNPILAAIGEEYVTCNNMLNMMMEDVIANNNTVEAVFGRALDKVSDSIDEFINVLADKVEEMNLDLDQIDIDKYKGLIDLIPKK